MNEHSEALLDAIWKGRLEVLAINLATGGREHLEIASLARHIEADYGGRFIIELLQNGNDQALKAGLSATTMHIVRVPGLVAVTNDGAPFDEKGARSVTELGLSPKEAGFAIGNKGVGFKSVFQVSNAPEISSGVGVEGTFLDNGYRFRFDGTPFQESAEAERLGALTDRLFERYPDLPDRIRAQSGAEDPRAELLTHAKRSAPFRFPLPFLEQDVRGRLAQLDLPELATRAPTLVVLPIRDDAKTCKVVDTAFDEVLADGAAMLLFLRGVARLVVVDRIQQRQVVFEREDGPRRRVARGGRFHHFVERTMHVVRADGLRSAQSWLVVERTIGDEGDSETPEAAAGERELVRDAAQQLRHENWKSVDRATVVVAVPLLAAGGGGALAPDGRFCIGLPTLDGTGTPLWIDARFHGTISRKGIVFNEPYNALLFDEATRLTGDLIAALRESPTPERRRLAALALRCHGDGRFVKALRREPDGLARSEFVLAADGERFLKPAELVVPSSADGAVFEIIERAAGGVERFGFVLPDRVLLEKARTVIDGLPGSTTSNGADNARYLKRKQGSISLLEAVARGLRAQARTDDFERFLEWVCHRFKVAELDDQAILPVGERDLAARRDRVFFSPVSRGATRRDASIDVAGEDSEPAEIPADVRGALRFIDESVVTIRVGERDLSALARSLAPDSGGGLVKRPRIPEVIDEAMAPGLLEAAKRGEHDLALRLLEMVFRWLVGLQPKSRAEVHADRLRVPVIDAAGKWSWVPPDDAVFGRGWLGGRQEELLLRSYADDDAPRLLVPWDELAQRLVKHGGAEPPDPAFWRGQLASLGVWSSPRILVARALKAPLVARSHDELTIVDFFGPFPGVYLYWQHWLDAIRVRHVPTRSGQEYDFDEVHWIEHLDDANRRAGVVEAMLRHPQRYLARKALRLRRTYQGWDPHEVPAFWTHALGNEGWSVVPTMHHGVVPASRAFRLERDQAARFAERYAFLPHPGTDLDDAGELLEAMGVPLLACASPRKLVTALHELASALPVPPERERSAHALAADLYRRLQAVCDDEEDVDLSTILAHPVPLERNRRLEAVDPTAGESIYIADDPVRFRLLQPNRILVLPLASGTVAAALVKCLRAALGSPSRIVFASEAPIDSGFQADPALPRMLVFDAIRHEFQDVDVESDVACIVAYLGKQAQQPSSDGFSRTWRRLRVTELIRGRFRDGFPHESLLHEEPNAPPALLVRSSLKRSQLVEAAWATVGIGHRDAFALYARALENGVAAVERFFAERSVGTAERAEVEEVIGSGLGVWLKPLRPLVLVAWRKRHPGVVLDQFLADWGHGVKSLSALDTFTSYPGLSAWLSQHRHLELEALVTKALEDLELEADALVQAIGDLSSDLVFEGARRAWERHLVQLTASIMAVTARRARVDHAEARDLVEVLREEGIPTHLERRPRHDELTRAALLDLARAWMASLRSTVSIEAITTLLSDDGPRRPPPSGFALPNDVSVREVNEFADHDEETRTADSAEVLDDVLTVASRLAARRAVSLDEAAIRSDSRVALASAGFFANRYALLAVLGDALDHSYPDIARTLREARAFHSPLGRHELVKRLEAELGPEASPAPGPAPSPIEIAGMEIQPDDLAADLALGGAGRVGQRLSAAAQAASVQIDLTALRDRALGTADAPLGQASQNRRKRGRGRTHGETRKVRDRIGLIGEIFAFELLSELLDDFDHANWCSESRNAYGFGAQGADEAGTDFEWVDRNGQLTDRDDGPRCLIEVKSSAGDADGPFHLSINQWNVAQRCHQSGGREIYIILRVAHVAIAPQLVEILIDPVQMERDKQLVLSQSEMWAWIGEALSDEVPED